MLSCQTIGVSIMPSVEHEAERQQARILIDARVAEHCNGEMLKKTSLAAYERVVSGP